MSIPKLQIGAWLDEPKEGARLRIRNDIEVREPKENEVLVRLEYTGLW